MKINCKKFRDRLQQLKADYFEGFIPWAEESLQVDGDEQTKEKNYSYFKKAITGLSEDLETTITNIPNFQIFKLPAPSIMFGPGANDKVRTNIRKRKKLEGGMVVSIGDIVHAKFSYKGISYTQDCTIEGFVLETDKIIASFVEDKPLIKLLRNKGYVIVDEIYKKVA